MIQRFVLYGLAGWVTEVLWTGFGSLLSGDPRLRSHTYLWMFPIYGGAVLLEFIHDSIREWHWVTRGLLYMSLIFTIEYTSGWAIRGLVGISPWIYTNRFSIDGLIRLDYAPAWFAAGLVFEKIHDYLDERRIFPY